ncbi:hypothetical protein NLJ89_g9191 [Agrocybe chaxingu]|uniref:Uncharacterized protein n=1 Tax=Agrocybe chaxingu TaxID=84603 RepID=A0A9W8MQ37_9AGAR|nr:hypothetical protein NLJ89_g9191 [Agrocybe chaxingu]
MSPIKVHLITGANRGIGKLFRPRERARRKAQLRLTVYAGVRDPAKFTALQELSTKFPGKVEVVIQKLLPTDEETHKNVTKVIQDKHGCVDVVVANAAIVLFQAVLPLLKASKSTPKFIPITSSGGSLTAYIDQPYEIVRRRLRSITSQGEFT